MFALQTLQTKYLFQQMQQAHKPGSFAILMFKNSIWIAYYVQRGQTAQMVGFKINVLLLLLCTNIIGYWSSLNSNLEFKTHEIGFSLFSFMLWFYNRRIVHCFVFAFHKESDEEKKNLDSTDDWEGPSFHKSSLVFTGHLIIWQFYYCLF